MNSDRAPLTNAALADALAIVSRAPALDPPLYICHHEHCTSAVQTFILGPLHTTSDPNTFWTREQGGVYDYTSGTLILRRRGIIMGPDILTNYDLRGDMRSPEYTRIRIGFPGREGYLHALAVWIDDGKWEDTAELATSMCDLYEGGALQLESHAPVPMCEDLWYTRAEEDMRPIRAYDFALALDGDLVARRARVVLHSLGGEELAEPRVVGVISSIRPPGTAGSKAAERQADSPGAWFLTVARSVEPDMLVVAVDAWGELMRTTDAVRNQRREVAKKGKNGRKMKK